MIISIIKLHWRAARHFFCWKQSVNYLWLRFHKTFSDRKRRLHPRELVFCVRSFVLPQRNCPRKFTNRVETGNRGWHSMTHFCGVVLKCRIANFCVSICVSFHGSFRPEDTKPDEVLCNDYSVIPARQLSKYSTSSLRSTSTLLFFRSRRRLLRILLSKNEVLDR